MSRNESSDRFVAYYRVSTDRQGRSGLGLDAQRTSVSEFLKQRRGGLIHEATEVESGRRCDRPKLREAIRIARVHRAILVIAKLDRLARNVAFISSLMDSDIEFIAVDFPTANRLTIHVLAAVAEHEAAAISQRTREAMAAAKARGVRLGGDKGKFNECRALGNPASSAARRMKANARAADLAPLILERRENGASLARIASELTELGVPTARNGQGWSATQVARVLARTSSKNPIENCRG